MNKDLVYLVQTDTTVGFSSANDEKLFKAKQRPKEKKILNTVDSFKTLKQNTRIPKNFKKLVRNSKKTTFIYPNTNSYRVIDKSFKFYEFISKFGILLSTSANISGGHFDYKFASDASDIRVYEKDDFDEKTASKIYILKKKKSIRIR